MEEIVLIFWVLVLGSECCFAQASATAKITVEIIDECALIKDAGYDCEKLSPANRSRIVDSMLYTKDMQRVTKQMAVLSYANNYDKAGKPLHAMVALSKEQQHYGRVYGKVDPSVWGDLCKLFYHNKTPKKVSTCSHLSKNGINWHK